MRPLRNGLSDVPDLVGRERRLELDVVPDRPIYNGREPSLIPRPPLPNRLVSPLARFLEQGAVTPQPVSWKLFAAIVGA